jgi:hypothetical protein
MMEENGGINEIYNFYVGTTLQNQANASGSSFYRQYAAASDVPYTSSSAINGISQIPQSAANYYINMGRDAALAIGQVYGCTPGALTIDAIDKFTQDVNASKDSYNYQIDAVKADKLLQNAQWAAAIGGISGSSGSNASGGSSGSSSNNSKHNDKCTCSPCPTPSTCHCGNTDWGLSAGFVDIFFKRDMCQGIWYSPIGAVQKFFGYNNIWDFFFKTGEVISGIIPPFNVSQDAFYSTFREDGKFWRIEAWKGNYMNMGVGAEIGIYTTTFLPIHYGIAKSDDRPSIQYTLSHWGKALFRRQGTHWWLTGFRPGIGSITPDELVLTGSLRFGSQKVAKKFGDIGNVNRTANKITLDIEVSKYDSQLVNLEWQ